MSQFLPYIVIILMIYILVFASHSILSLIWTMLMTSYNLSLPGLLWGGTITSFPSFIPTGTNSPMAFYYWFFIIAVIVFVVSLALISFRHLAVWGKFDEQQEYEGTNFWHRFKWFIILAFMTILTPILIWVIYSAFTLGVTFLMNLLGNNTMFFSISEDEYNQLMQKVKEDLDAVINMDTATLKSALQHMIDQPQLINDYLLQVLKITDATTRSVMQQQIINNLKSIINNDTGIDAAMAGIKAAAQNIVNEWSKVSFKTPIDSVLLQKLNESITGLYSIDVTTDSTGLSIYNFWGAWMQVFDPIWTEGSTSYNFESLAQFFITRKAEGSSEIQTILTQLQNVKTSEEVNVFKIIGFGTLSDRGNGLVTILGKLRGASPYTWTKNESVTSYAFNINVLTYKNGRKIGLQDCPFDIFLTAILTGNNSIGSQIGFYSELTYKMLIMIEGAIMGFMGQSTMQKAAAHMASKIPFVAAAAELEYITGSLMAIGGTFMVLINFVLAGISMFVYMFGFALIAKPLLGITIFLWKSFFEAMWYFFLLLPAIGASVLDNGREVYKRQWKQCIGKMAATLITWCGILLMFTALFQVDKVYDMIWNGLTQASEGELKPFIPIEIKLNPGLLKFITSGFITITFNIHITEVIKFILAVVVLTATCNIIQRIGILTFGEEVYGDVNNIFANPLSAFSPGFQQSVQKLGGMMKSTTQASAKGVSKVADKAGKANWQGLKDARDKKKNDKKFDRQQDKIKEQGKSNQILGGKLSGNTKKIKSLEDKIKLETDPDKKKKLQKQKTKLEKRGVNIQNKINSGKKKLASGYSKRENIENQGKILDAQARENKQMWRETKGQAILQDYGYINRIPGG